MATVASALPPGQFPMVQSTIPLEQLPSEPDVPSHDGCGGCGTGRALAESTRCGNGLEKIYPTTAVRFGYMRYIGEFSHAPDLKFTCGARVVIQTRRGIEMGEQVSLTCNGCSKSVTREQMKAWVASCGEDSYLFDAGRILREATAADLAEYARIQGQCREKKRFCQDLAHRYKLPMRVIDCESPFGGERIIFYFTAAERVDFRALVKDLAHEYRTRIEMRQVGARDEARLLADFETCGREVCCKVFLKTLRPISMRMAKLQKATLDPSQVSGRCGRLKCCLRYEHVGYEELDKSLPRTGVRIRTSHGDGVIINRQVLTQLVQIRMDNDKILTVVAEDILEVGIKAQPLPPPPMQRERRDRPTGPRKRLGAPDVARPRNEPDEQTPASPSAGAPAEGTHEPGDPPSGNEPGPARDENRSRRSRRRGPRRRGPRSQGPPRGGGAPPQGGGDGSGP